MKKLFGISAALLGLFVLSTSCGKESDAPKQPEIKLAAESAEVGYEAGNGSFSYSITNINDLVPSATCVSNDAWLKVDSVTDNSVSFTYEENTSTSSRTGSLTFSYSGASSKKFTVTQAGGPEKPVAASVISLSESYLNIAAEGASAQKVTYQIANPINGASLSATSDASWAKVDKCADGEILVSVEANTSTDSRTAKVTLAYRNAESKVLTVDQMGAAAAKKPKIIVESLVQTIPAQGGDFSFKYEIENPVQGAYLSARNMATEYWAQAESTAGGVVKYRAYENPLGPRSCELTLTYPNADTVIVTINQSDGSSSVFLNTPYITTLSNLAGKKTVTLTATNGDSSKSFSVKSGASWLKASVSNKDQLTLEYTENTSTADRTATLVISYPGASDLSFNVTQYGAPAFTFTAGAKDLYFRRTQQTLGVPYTYDGPSDYEIEYEFSDNWIRNGGHNVTEKLMKIFVLTNDSGAERNGVATLICTAGGKSKKVTVNIHQSAKVNAITLTPASKTVDYKEQSVSFKVSLDNPGTSKISLLRSDSWMSIPEISSDNVVTFTVSKNAGKNSRSATIKVSYYDHADETFTITQEGAPVPASAVDLGLPSGKFWASTNLGASNASATGTYFAWGEVEAKTSYSWSNYKYGLEASISKYNATDNKTRLENADDAARTLLGAGWSMPTQYDMLELEEYCNKEVTTLNGVKGVKFTSKVNGESIFIPYTGRKDGTNLKDSDIFLLWSSDKPSGSGGNVSNGWAFNGEANNAVPRYQGLNIRAVYTL